MTNNDFIPGMYRIIDSMDSQGLVDMMTENSEFRFANMPGVVGNSNIFEFLEGFFKSIKGIKHTDLEYWYTDNTWFATGSVTYTRHDSSELKVPFSVILKMEAELIDKYLVFLDASLLYA